MSASSGTPDDVDTSYETLDGQENTKIRIGDPDSTITGKHTYTIRYRSTGCSTVSTSHDELYLNVTGNGVVRADQVDLRHGQGPGRDLEDRLLRREPGSKSPCETSARNETATAGEATFSQGSLATGAGLTSSSECPRVSSPILTTRASCVSAGRSPRRSASTAPPAPHRVACSSPALGLMGMLGWRNGRDRRYAGSVVDAAFGNATGDDGPVPAVRPVGRHRRVRAAGGHPARPHGHPVGRAGEPPRRVGDDRRPRRAGLAPHRRDRAPKSDGFLGFGGDGGDYQLVQLRDHATDPQASELWEAEKSLLSLAVRHRVDGATVRPQDQVRRQAGDHRGPPLRRRRRRRLVPGASRQDPQPLARSRFRPPARRHRPSRSWSAKYTHLGSRRPARSRSSVSC